MHVLKMMACERIFWDIVKRLLDRQLPTSDRYLLAEANSTDRMELLLRL